MQAFEAVEEKILHDESAVSNGVHDKLHDQAIIDDESFDAKNESKADGDTVEIHRDTKLANTTYELNGDKKTENDTVVIETVDKIIDFVEESF